MKSNNVIHNYQLSQVCQAVGPLMEPKPKLLVHQNVVPNLIVMSECDNMIHLFCRNMTIRSQLVMPEVAI